LRWHPERVQALVTVASSPCFSAQDAWPGIKPEVLAGFQQQLSEDFQRTVERFLALQTMGTETASGCPHAETDRAVCRCRTLRC
jgi:pimeloyl-[acyl-carrier protein] methyl ester esterase